MPDHETTLFLLTPLPTIIKDAKGRATRHAPYAHQRGHGPEGYTCATCAFLLARDMRSGKRFFKCGWVKVTGGPGTDIRKKDPACSKYEHGPGREIYPAHGQIRSQPLSMFSIKEDRAS